MPAAQIQVDAHLLPADLAALSRAAKLAPKELRREFSARVRKVGKPVGKEIVRQGVADIPHGGGLFDRVAAAVAGQSASFVAGGAQVTLTFRKPRVLRYIDQGKIPHPVYAQGPRNGWHWTVQPTKAGVFSRAFDAQADPVERELIAGMDEVAKKLGFT